MSSIGLKAEAAYKACMDLYYCEFCGGVRRITEGFTRKADEPAIFYTGKVLKWCFFCQGYQIFIKLVD